MGSEAGSNGLTAHRLVSSLTGAGLSKTGYSFMCVTIPGLTVAITASTAGISGPKQGYVVARGMKHHNGKPDGGQILLIFQVAIDSKEKIKLSGGKFQ